MADVFANGRSIVHKGDGLQHVSAPPDVCKTPTPGGPAPLPYPNMAMDSDLAKGAKKVKINGKPVAHAKSNLKTSTGDEAGTAGGGVVSNKFKGKMTWSGSSGDVRVEGNGVVRFMDPTGHNNNSFNTAFTAMGGTGVAYFNDFHNSRKCNICRESPANHAVLELKAFYDKVVKDIISGPKSLYEVDHSFSIHNQNPNNRAKKGRLARTKSQSPGYMVGIVLCKDNKKLWAISGPAPHPPLIDFMCKTHKFDLYVNSGPVTADDLMKVNPLMNDPKNPQESKKRRERFERAWGEAATNNRNRDMGWLLPGNCAAAKLVASGHIPLSMTEFYFAPTGTSWSGSYGWKITNLSKEEQDRFDAGVKAQNDQTWRTRIINHHNKRFKKHTFVANQDTVASCHTCQYILYRLMCKKDERSCADSNTQACSSQNEGAIAKS